MFFLLCFCAYYELLLANYTIRPHTETHCATLLFMQIVFVRELTWTQDEDNLMRVRLTVIICYRCCSLRNLNMAWIMLNLFLINSSRTLSTHLMQMGKSSMPWMATCAIARRRRRVIRRRKTTRTTSCWRMSRWCCWKISGKNWLIWDVKLSSFRWVKVHVNFVILFRLLFTLKRCAKQPQS